VIPHTRVAIRIPVALKQQLAALARHRRVAMTDLVEAALQRLLAADPPPPAVAQRLDHLARDVRTLQRGQEILAETLGLFINVYLSTTPEVPPAQDEAARRTGGRRYAKFLKVLEGKLAHETGGRHDDAAAAESPGPGA
jgi:hypothetical protein